MCPNFRTKAQIFVRHRLVYSCHSQDSLLCLLLGISAGDYLQVELRSGELVIIPCPRHNERGLLLAYAKEHSKEQVAIEEIHRMFSGLPFQWEKG